ncbi:MAG: cation transporter [Nitrospirae bacterium]|nr:cation transporter [Nitrospirota bacterium]
MGKDTSSIKDISIKVRKVLLYTLFLNFLVASAKIFYGYITNSVAIISDGFHSFFDGISNIIGLIGTWIASHPPDKEHPYGHKKYETFFTVIISFMIFLTCFQILKKIYFFFTEGFKPAVTSVSFTLMFVTIGINIFVMLYESKKGKDYGSSFLIADAMHTKSDILSSLTVIISLFLTRKGYTFADPLVGIIITFLIARIGYRILKDASDILVDTVCIDTSAIKYVVNHVKGVKSCHDIRTRGSMNSVYLDLHVIVDSNLSTQKAHEIADNIEKEIKQEFPAIVDIIVHIEPDSLAH